MTITNDRNVARVIYLLVCAACFVIGVMLMAGIIYVYCMAHPAAWCMTNPDSCKTIERTYVLRCFEAEWEFIPAEGKFNPHLY